MAPPKFYAVYRGRSTGMFKSWPECQQQIHRFPGAIFKSFTTITEAEAYLLHCAQIYGPIDPSKTIAGQGLASTVTSGCFSSSNDKPHSVTKTPASRERPHGVFIESSCSSSDYNEPQLIENSVTKTSTSRERSRGVFIESSSSDDFELQQGFSEVHVRTKLVVYTDGSCIGNGTASARAGYGAFYGQNDLRNISSRLEGSKQTNQRAELTAVSEVLKRIDPLFEKHVEIRSDSMYTINASTIWMKNYVEGVGVKKNYTNLDLMMDIYVTICDLEKSGIEVKFKYVPAHSGHEGNEMADNLAKLGAWQE